MTRNFRPVHLFCAASTNNGVSSRRSPQPHWHRSKENNEDYYFIRIRTRAILHSDSPIESIHAKCFAILSLFSLPQHWPHHSRNKLANFLTKRSSNKILHVLPQRIIMSPTPLTEKNKFCNIDCFLCINGPQRS